MTVAYDGHEVHDGVVEVSSVGESVDGDSLIEQPHLGLGLHLVGLHHDGHGVRLLVHLVRDDRNVRERERRALQV